MTVIVVEGSFFPLLSVFPYTHLCRRGCVSTRLALKLYSTRIHVHSGSLSKALLLFPALFTRHIPSRFTLRKQKHLMKYSCCICGRLDNRPGAKHVWCEWLREVLIATRSTRTMVGTPVNLIWYVESLLAILVPISELKLCAVSFLHKCGENYVKHNFTIFV